MAGKSVPFAYKRAKPLDMSFETASSLGACEFHVFQSDSASAYRMLGVPPKSGGRYKTASVLLNCNRLTGLTGIRTLAVRMLYQPDALCWLDVSDNRLEDVPAGELSRFPNLRTLYLHRNRLTAVDAVADLGRLPALRSLTLQHNPLAAGHGYRALVLALLPRLTGLDFVRVTDGERLDTLPVSVRRIVDREKQRHVVVPPKTTGPTTDG